MQDSPTQTTPLNQAKSLSRVLITAGGTGGHIFPGLAVAKRLIEQGVQVEWVGTDYGLEKELVPKAGIPLHFLPVRGLRGKGISRLLAMPLMLGKSIYQSVKLINTFKPQVVFSLGGYASGPLAIAAKLKGIPLILHEQNAAPGLTNRVLAPIASKVLVGLPNRFSSLKNYAEVGNPVRSDFVELYQQRQLQIASNSGTSSSAENTEVRVLIVGGSQGAEKLNKAVPVALGRIAKSNPDIKLHVVHQSGKSKLESTQQAYQDTGLQVNVAEFIDDMSGAYEWADIVIGRAGALTVAEVAAAGVVCIFVPLAIAVDDHQTLNAMSLVNQEAALLVTESQLTSGELIRALQSLILDGKLRRQMSDKALSLAKVNAAQEICTHIEQLVS